MNEKLNRQLQSYTQNTGFFFYAVKKTERLARAIYLITNFFSDDEPLKWRLRSESLALLEKFSEITSSASSADLSFIRHSLHNSLAGLGVAHTAGLISEMNYSILRYEYEELEQALEREVGDDGKHSALLFPKDFFAVPEDKSLTQGIDRYLYSPAFENQSPFPTPRPREDTTGEIDTRQPSTPRKVDTETHTAGELPTTDTTSKGQTETLKDIKDIKRTTTPDNHTTSKGQSKGQPTSKTELSSDERRAIILQLVKDRKEISVKDAARQIQNYSEKTLQREILALVDEGVLERIGARRWSRYRLASR